ncbi:MAG: site-specific integrase [Anaerolineales bacterium]|nr:site-specific integrase [Anaerolineales bacterium]
MDRLFNLFVQAIRKSAPVAAPGYAREVSLFLDWLRECGLRVESANASDLSRYLVALTQRFQPSTAARKFSAIRRFYAVLAEQGQLPANPAALVPVSLAAYRSRPRLRPTLESIKPIPTTSMQGVRDLAILRLVVFGLSPAQLVALDVADFDVAAQAVRLNGRSGRRRIQPLDPDTFAALRRWMALRQMLNPADSAVFLSLHWTAGRTSPHQRLSRRGLFDVVRRYWQ